MREEGRQDSRRKVHRWHLQMRPSDKCSIKHPFFHLYCTYSPELRKAQVRLVCWLSHIERVGVQSTKFSSPPPGRQVKPNLGP